jgi:hypothetical protein
VDKPLLERHLHRKLKPSFQFYPLIYNPNTAHITPQYHVIFDEHFQAGTSNIHTTHSSYFEQLYRKLDKTDSLINHTILTLFGMQLNLKKLPFYNATNENINAIILRTISHQIP